MKIGLFTDNHSSGLEKKFAEKMQDVDLILFTGDLVEHSTKEKIYKALIPFCELGIPFYAIPGNYEKPRIWHDICDYLTENHPNFVNAAKKQVCKFENFNLVFIPGTEKSHFNGEAFKVTVDNLLDLIKQVENLNNILLITHEPPKQDYKTGTDVGVQAKSTLDDAVLYGEDIKKVIDSGLYKVEYVNQGNKKIRAFIDRLNIKFVFSGHMHKACNAVNYIGKRIKENTFTDSLYFNPGAAKDGWFGLVDIEEVNGILQAKYQRKILFDVTSYD